MAGKHWGGAAYTTAGTHPAVYPGRKENKAFAEGALGVPASNPHPSGSPANAAYTAGAAAGLIHEVPGSGTALSAAAAAALGYLPNAYTATEQTAVATFIDSQVAAGNWTSIESFILFGLSDATNAVTDMIDGGTATLVGTPTHTQRGTGYVFVCNGIVDYIRTGYTPAAGREDDGCLGVYVRDIDFSVVTQPTICGNSNATQHCRIRRSTTPSVQGSYNSASIAEITAELGINSALHMQRTAADDQRVYDDAASATSAGASTFIAVEMAVNGMWNGSAIVGPSDDAEYAVWWAGAALSNVASWQTAIGTLVTNLGISDAS